MAGVVSFAQESGKPLEWPPKRVRDQKGCRQLPPRQTGLLTVPSPVPCTQGQELGIALCELRLVSPVPPPQLSTRLWALVLPIPGCVCRTPWEDGEEAQQAGSEQRLLSQVFCTSCQRQTGTWGIRCLWGWGKQWVGRREAVAASRPAEPCGDD